MLLKRLYNRITDSNGVPTFEKAMRDPRSGEILEWVPHRVVAGPNDDSLSPDVRMRIERDEDDTPFVTGIIIKRLPVNGRQRFSPTLIEGGIAEGWLTKTDTTITIHCQERGDVVFDIDNVPGRYSCFDLSKLEDDPDGALARKHIAEKHKGKPSPDQKHPSGYKCKNYYGTTVRL